MSDGSERFFDRIGPAPRETGIQWFGHPAGLSTLFFTEMWERFSYYGMRAILILFMTAPVAAGGLGWEAARAGPIYGLYTAMVYVMALPGGWVADRVIGGRAAVLVGGLVIMSGHISLMFHGLAPFYLGLTLIVVGTGLLKPNISALVGTLYEEQDVRRDAGFSIFYMGINIGAFFSPLICGFLAQHVAFQGLLSSAGFDPNHSWHWGFGAAAVGMALGVVQYLLGSTPAGRVFQWIALAGLIGFFVFMAYHVLGGAEVEPARVVEVSSSVVAAGIVLAIAVTVLHVAWLLSYVLASGAVRETLKWVSVGSSLALLAITFVVQRRQEWVEGADVGELEPRNPILLGCLFVSVLTVLYYTVRLLRTGNRILGIAGIAVAIGLVFADFERAVDPDALELIVGALKYALPLVSFVYFARIFLDRSYSEIEHRRLAAVPVFFLGAAVFWSFFEQAGSSLSLFAESLTVREVLGVFVPASWFQSVNALLIVLLAPVFAWAWPRLARQGREPSSPVKFAAGIYLLGVGFAVVAFAAIVSGPDGGQVGPGWLLSVYLLHTVGELCLSPVGLSTMTKLAPARLAGQMMGVWFLGAAIGNFIAGLLAGLFETLPLPQLFGMIFVATLVATAIMLAIAKPVRALMSGVN
ncbi:MAG TPA: peptide MFS transporter [Thermoanaerobaculia bacterium]|nr:peptide MFS transporter [Thermoanaerobaculia bacterium]